MFLDYFALGLFFVIIVFFYGMLAIRDIAHQIAKSRKVDSDPLLR